MQQRITDAECIIAMRAVKAAGGNQLKASKEIGVPLSTLRRQIDAGEHRGLTSASKIISETDRLDQELRAAKRRIEMLERERESAENFREEVFGIARRSPNPPEWLLKPGKLGKRGGPALLISDLHYGEVVNPEEVGGVNEYNKEIALRRLRKLAEKTIDLSFNHMGRANTEYPGLVLMLGGDMGGGEIHLELAKTNDRTAMESVNDLTDNFGTFIEVLLGKFGKLFIPAVPGNHGRDTIKPQKKQYVHTNFDWLLYCNLARTFRNEPRVQFLIPNETDAFFNVYGHRYMLTHGDNLGVKGGDGIIGAIGPIMRGTMKLHRSEAQIGRDFDTACICHWHQYLTLPGLIVNNAFKGYDEYARLALRAPYSRPSQALWFTHPEHGITAHWQVYLEALRTAHQNKKWIEFPQT